MTINSISYCEKYEISISISYLAVANYETYSKLKIYLTTRTPKHLSDPVEFRTSSLLTAQSADIVGNWSGVGLKFDMCPAAE